MELLWLDLDRFFFSPVDRRVATLFRILFTPVLAIGFLSRSELRYVVGLHDPWLVPYVLCLCLLLLLFGLGYRPRLCGFALCGLLLPLLELPGRGESRQVLLFSLLALSVLRTDPAWTYLRPGSRSTESSAGPMWPIRLIQFQLTALYGVNALAKSNPAYLSGDVLMGMSRMLPNFVADFSSGYWMVGPLAIPIAVAAVASVLTEYTLTLGFWFRRLRLATAVIGVGFHLTLKWIVRIGFLDWVSMFLYLAFLLPFGGSGYQRSSPSVRRFSGVAFQK